MPYPEKNLRYSCFYLISQSGTKRTESVTGLNRGGTKRTEKYPLFSYPVAQFEPKSLAQTIPKSVAQNEPE
nr:hypothetical protein [uncultured Draconibacterium sp.]